MFTRYPHAAILTAALLAVTSFAGAGEEKPIHGIKHQHDVTVLGLAQTAQTSTDHEAVAKRFEEKAARFDQEAAEHERLAERYRKGLGIGPKGNAASMANHCDRLAKSLRASATDARAMAQLHRDVAHQLAK